MWLFLCDNGMDKYQRKIIKLANKGIKRMKIINKKIIFKVSNIYYCIYTSFVFLLLYIYVYKIQKLYQFPNKFKIKN